MIALRLFKFCIQRKQRAHECRTSIACYDCPSNRGGVTEVERRFELKGGYQRIWTMFRSQQRLKGGSGSNLETVALLFNGIKVEGLQVYDFDGFTRWFGEKRAASQRSPVRSSQKRQRLVQRFGSVIGSNHRSLSPGDVALL